MRTASLRWFGRSRGSSAPIAARARSTSRVNGTRITGWTPASITITSAPRPASSMSWTATRRASAKRLGETSVAFIDADTSMTTTSRSVPLPCRVMVGRARASASSTSAKICSKSSGSSCSRWKSAEACWSRRTGAHSSTEETRRCWRRTLRK